MYYTLHITFIGTLFLFLYILIDFTRNRTTNILRRMIFYSFIFYLLNIAQLTTGGIILSTQPPIEADFNRTQLIPFYFIWDLFKNYKLWGLDWFFGMLLNYLFII